MEIEPSISKENILAFDFDGVGDIIIINSNFKVFRNNEEIIMKKCFCSQSLKIKLLDQGEFLIIDQEIENRYNCWIYNNEGELVKSFFVGPVNKVITTKKYIIVSYSAASLGIKLCDFQIVVFDFFGNIVFKYYSDKNRSKIDFLEALCFLKNDEEIIFFIAFGTKSNKDFPVVQLNLNDFSSKVLFYLSDYDKDNLIFPKSFTVLNNEWYFFENSFLDENNNSKFIIKVHKLNAEFKIEEVFVDNTIALHPIGFINVGFAYLTINQFNISQINFYKKKASSQIDEV